MSSLLPIRFKTELARQFHRTFTNTITVSTDQSNSLTPINNLLYTYTATAGQTIFSGSDDNGNVLSYKPGKIQVFQNGERLGDSEYITDTGAAIELVTPASVGDVIVVAEYTVYTFPNPSDYYYVFVGRTQEWGDDLSPPTPVDTRYNEADTKNGIIAVKKVGANDVSLLIPRIDWQSGSVYEPYVDDETYYNRKFYVLNTSNRIYKCIASPGSPSTVMPEQTSTGPFYLEDGYCWQLIYEVPSADRARFLDENFIPVKFFSTSSTFDHNAIVDSIEIVSGGTGYATPPAISILGDGTGATAVATVSGGAVISIDVTNPGSGYTFALVQITGGGGSGASATTSLQSSDLPIAVNQDVASYALTTAGAIDVITVVDGGERYLPATTTLSIVGDGIGAIASPVVDTLTGKITGVNVTDRGRGYTFADVVVSSVTGSGAILKTTIGPEFGHGGDIPKELFAKTVGLSVNIEDSLTDFFLDNDFRQIGIIKNIRDFYKSELFSKETGTSCYVITVPSGQESKYAVDDIIVTDTLGKYRVTNRRGQEVYLLPIIDSIFVSSVLANETSGESGMTIMSLALPEISKTTGDIIYVNNTTPINRQQGQVEQLKLFFSF